MVNKDEKVEDLLWVTGTEVRDNKYNSGACLLSQEDKGCHLAVSLLTRAQEVLGLSP